MAHDQGLIVLWSGSIATIPAGWALCDGTLGTPDLRDLFVRGAGGALTPGDLGGALLHNHDFTGDGHTHSLPASGTVQAGAGRSDTTTSDPAVGTTDNAPSLPPFYALAYIMRL